MTATTKRAFLKLERYALGEGKEGAEEIVQVELGILSLSGLLRAYNIVQSLDRAASIQVRVLRGETRQQTRRANEQAATIYCQSRERAKARSTEARRV
jgi:hypothetical protein